MTAENLDKTFCEPSDNEIDFVENVQVVMNIWRSLIDPNQSYEFTLSGGLSNETVRVVTKDGEIRQVGVVRESKP